MSEYEAARKRFLASVLNDSARPVLWFVEAADKEIAFIKTSHQQILKVLEANRAELIGNYEAELARLREVENKYQELLYQVASKFPDESRHDTAKRYIHDAEHGDIGPEKTDCG